MNRAELLVFFLAFSGTAFAASTEVAVPSEGWSIRFESPILSNQQDSRRDGGYAFRATSDRFNISLFVENPQETGTAHRDCFESYWAHSSENPLIAKDTVVTSENPTYVRVQYDLVTEFEGKPIRSRNVNYYFTYRGKWTDVHISIVQPTKADEEVFAAFDRSLSYGP